MHWGGWSRILQLHNRGLEGEFKANNLVKHFSNLGIGSIHRPTLNISHHKIAYLLELPSYAEPGENEHICS